jgi:hypothetical protein
VENDEDENLLERIVREMEDEQWKKRHLHGASSAALDIANNAVPKPPWLAGSTVEILRQHIHFITMASDVEGSIKRMRLLAECLTHEADKLQAKGAVNFHENFDLH